MVNQHYQKQAWKKNRSKIIKLLNKEPLTFSELIRKSLLSRAVVNDHLKALETDGLVRKVYDSASRKILNVLQFEKLDLTEWLLRQLENFDVPQEILNRGRGILSQPVLLNSVVAYGYIWNNTQDILSYSKVGMTGKEGKTLFRLIPISSKLKVPEFQSVFKGKNQEIVRMLLSDLSPYAFTIVMTEYKIEKSLFAEATRELKKTKEFFFPRLSRDMKESFDKVSEWWLNEVVEYLPSGRFMQYWTFIYSNALSRRLQTIA